MAGLAAIQRYIDSQKIDKTKPGWKVRLPKAPFDVDFKGVKVTWKLQTNVGDIAIRLMPEVAPKHVASTVYLTRLGFYDDVPFHRVIPGFMAQGGDPTGTGREGTGYQYAGEFDPALKHTRGGLLSMANAGPGTDGSQFFLTFVATPWLDGKHTIFGATQGGEAVLRALEACGSSSGRTSEPLRMEQVAIEVD